MKRKWTSILLALMLLVSILPMPAIASEASQGAGGFQEALFELPAGFTQATLPTRHPSGGYAIAAYFESASMWVVIIYNEIGADYELVPLSNFTGVAISGISYSPQGQLIAYEDGMAAFMTDLYAVDASPAVDETPTDESEVAATEYVYQMPVLEGKVYRFDETGDMLSEITVLGSYGMQAIPLADGSIITTSDEAACILYDAQGKELVRYGDAGQYTLCAAQDTLYLISSASIQLLDLITLKKNSSIPLTSSGLSAAAVDTDGTLWLANIDGLFSLAQGTDALTLQYPMSGSMLSDPQQSITSIVMLTGGSFIASYQATGIAGFSFGETPTTYATYAYSSNLGIANKDELTITALRDSVRLRKAVNEFQRQHPEIRVNLTTQLSANSTDPTDDAIRTLNTQLLAGQGGDVLILDGLSMDRYIQRGLLIDLTEALGDIDFLPGIQQGSISSDGKLYAMPAQFTFDTLWGSSNAVSAIKTLSDLQNIPLETGQTIITPKAYEEWLRMFFPVSRQAFTDDLGQLNFESPEFITFLQTLGALYAAQGDLPVSSSSIQRGIGIAQDEILAVMNKASLIAYHQITSWSSIPIAYTICGAKDSAYSLMPAIDEKVAAYQPALLAGINAQSKKQDLAVQFLRTLYSMDVQTLEQTEGLPTLAAAMDTLIAAKIEESKSVEIVSVITFGDDNNINLVQPDEDAWNALRALCDTLTTPIYQDDVLLGFIIEETAAFFDGSLTAEQAAQALQQRAWTYLNE